MNKSNFSVKFISRKIVNANSWIFNNFWDFLGNLTYTFFCFWGAKTFYNSIPTNDPTPILDAGVAGFVALMLAIHLFKTKNSSSEEKSLFDKNGYYSSNPAFAYYIKNVSLDVTQKSAACARWKKKAKTLHQVLKRVEKDRKDNYILAKRAKNAQSLVEIDRSSIY